MEEKNRFLALAIVLVIFPVVLVYAMPLIPVVQKFYGGDRSYWIYFWLVAFALEWLTLAIVLLTLSRMKDSLTAIGFPTTIPKTQRIILLTIFMLFAILAALGSGGPQDFLKRIPLGVQMFIPPSDLGSRLFWLCISLTAAICEETLWRGIAITELKKLFGSTIIAIAISSFAFTFFHGGFQQGFATFIYRFTLAIGLSLIYLKSGKLIWPMMIHFIMDAFALAAIQYD